MHLQVVRKWETSKSVCGQLYLDGQLECFTLEPSRDNPVHPGHPCIPAGTYKVILTPSPHLGYLTPEVLDVPGRSEIRIHIGNWPKDSLGCTLVGMTHLPDAVGDSRSAFNGLMVLLRNSDSIDITYTEEICTGSQPT